MNVGSSLQFGIYLLGPFLAALLVFRRFGVPWRVFWIGFPAFFLSQVGVTIFSVAGAFIAFGLDVSISFWTAVLGAIGAGVCEEGCRYYALRHVSRRGVRPSWNVGLMYAVGHSGLETLLVGFGLLLAVLTVVFAPDQVAGDTLVGLSAVGELGFVKSSALALERMVGGLVIHLAFTSLVVLSLLRGNRMYLWGAMAWHAAHDMVFLQPGLQDRLHTSDGFHAAVIGSLLVAYLVVVWWLRERCGARVDSDSAPKEPSG